MRRVVVVAVVLLLPVVACWPRSGDDSGSGSTQPEAATTAPQTGSARPRLPDVQSADPASLPPAVDALLRGRVVDEAGQPAAGVSALVQHRTGEANLLGVVFVSAFALGLPLLACLAEPPNICDDEVTDPVRVESDGGYEAVLPAAHIPGYEADTDWFFVATAPPSPGERLGPTSTYELEVAAPVQEAPDLVLWEPNASTTSNDGWAVIDWPPLGRGQFDGGELRYAVTVLDQDGAPVLEVTTANDDVAIDARLLEDAQATSTLTAYGDRTAGPTIYHQTMTAPGPDVSGIGPAPSRGASCTVAVGGTVVPIGSCPVTDGALSTAGLGEAVPVCAAGPPIPQPVEPVLVPPPTFDVPVPSFDTVPFTFPEFPDSPPPTAATSSSSTTTTTTPAPTTTAPEPFPPLPSNKAARQQPGACPATAEVVIALGERQSVDLVVARGCPTCEVSISTDGVTFEAMGDDPARRVSLAAAGVVAPAAPQPATHVRIQAPPDQLRLLTEVSVWPAPAASEPAEPLVAAPPAPGGGESRPIAPALGALVLIVATAAGLARAREARGHTVSP